MNSSTLQSVSVLAVIASVLLLPVSLPIGGIAVTITGLAAVLLADYGRKPARYAAKAAALSCPPKCAAPYAA